MENFSERHNLQKFNCVFDNTFVTILHSVTGDVLASLSSHIYIDSSVLLLYLGCLKSCVCLPKLSLKETFFTSARYTTIGFRYLFCSRQLSLDLQLQPYFVFETGFKMFLLCGEMIDEMLPIQL